MLKVLKRECITEDCKIVQQPFEKFLTEKEIEHHFLRGQRHGVLLGILFGLIIGMTIYKELFV